MTLWFCVRGEKEADPKGGRKPINAECETVDRLPMFRDAYRCRRGVLPVDGFFEWKAIRGQSVNAGAKMQAGRSKNTSAMLARRPRNWGPFPSGIKPLWDYPPRYRGWRDVACFD